ncbi:MAG: RDD family protein [Burkholderiales bacterium]
MFQRSAAEALVLAGIGRRIASLVYDAVLLFGVVFVAGYLFVALARDAQSGLPRFAFQLYLFSVCGSYFTFCWARSGQTLAMKTWRLRLATGDGAKPSTARAFLRYVLAIPSVGTGIGLLWAFFDRDRQFLHDRLAGTRIVISN